MAVWFLMQEHLQIALSPKTPSLATRGSKKTIIHSVIPHGRAKVYAGLMFPDIKNDFEKALDEAFDNGASGVSFFDGPSDEYLHKFKAYLDKKGLKTE